MPDSRIHPGPARGPGGTGSWRARGRAWPLGRVRVTWKAAGSTGPGRGCQLRMAHTAMASLWTDEEARGFQPELGGIPGAPTGGTGEGEEVDGADGEAVP
jgi:hypothetical protein